MTRGTRYICQLSDGKRVFMKCLRSCELIRLLELAVYSERMSILVSQQALPTSFLVSMSASASKGKSAVRSPWSAEPRPALAGKWRLSGSLTWGAFARFGSIPAAGFNDRFPRSLESGQPPFLQKTSRTSRSFPCPCPCPCPSQSIRFSGAPPPSLASQRRHCTLRHASCLSRTCTLCTDVGSGARSDRSAKPTPWQAPPNELYTA
jgi:hypothetical protein